MLWALYRSRAAISARVASHWDEKADTGMLPRLQGGSAMVSQPPAPRAEPLPVMATNVRLIGSAQKGAPRRLDQREMEGGQYRVTLCRCRLMMQIP
jgi:hypothetical protein